MQKPRTVVKNVIDCGITDYIPKGELCINDNVIKEVLGVEHVDFTEKLAFVQSMNLDIYSLSPQYECIAQCLPDKSQYRWPDLKNWTVGTELFTFAVLDGAFEWGMRLFGVVEFSCMLRSVLDVEDIIRQVEKLNLYMIEKLADEGINGIILADDIAYQQGLFANPKIIRDVFIPSLARQAEKIHSFNLPVFYHSDGNYLPVLGDIIKAGFTGLQCLEKTSGMNLNELQAVLGNEVCLWGHIDTDDLTGADDPLFMQTLPVKTKELAYGKKFILGTTSGLYEGMNIEALRTLYQNI